MSLGLYHTYIEECNNFVLGKSINPYLLDTHTVFTSV